MIYLTDSARFAALTELIVWIILIAGVSCMKPNSLEAASVQYIETGDPTAHLRVSISLLIASLLVATKLTRKRLRTR